MKKVPPAWLGWMLFIVVLVGIGLALVYLAMLVIAWIFLRPIIGVLEILGSC